MAGTTLRFLPEHPPGQPPEVLRGKLESPSKNGASLTWTPEFLGEPHTA